MDLSKSYEFFAPEKYNTRIHIIGCGSVGSTLAENLVRCGLTKITLWDFDKVEAHNIVNQMFRQQDVGKLKAEALKDILMDINPEVKDTIEVFSSPEHTSKIIYRPEMKIKDIKYHYDISNAIKDLGYKPKFFHIEMLKDMKEEMKKNRFDFLENK